MLDDKQMWAIFLPRFKMGHKAMETSLSTNQHLAQKLLVNTVQFKNFAKETRTLKMRSAVTGHQKLAMSNWEYLRCWFSYNYTRSCPRTLCWPFYSHLAFEANWKGENARYEGPSWADLKSKKMLFWSIIFSYFMQQQWATSRSDCDMQWKVGFIWQPAMTSSVAGLRISSKALPKAKLAPKKVMVTGSLILQFSKSQWNHCIWEKYTQQINERHWKLHIQTSAPK